MSSLQRPKKIVFVGSDGAEHPFLAKPKDDLRKDHRLMDFANLANRLFAADSSGRRRGLRLRTYAVNVLSEDCGILQVSCRVVGVVCGWDVWCACAACWWASTFCEVADRH